LNNDRIWTKEYVILIAANFFVAVNFYAQLVIGASFAIYDLGATETEAGFAAALYVTGALTSRLLLSRFARQRHFKPVLLLALGAMVVLSAFHFMISGFVLFCLLRFLGGATFGICSNVLMTLIALIIPTSRKGEGIAWYSMSQILGMVIGPFLAVYVMHQVGFNGVFLLLTVVTAMALITSCFAKKPEETGPEVSESLTDPDLPAAEERGIWKVFEKTAVRVALFCVIIYVCNSNYQAFAPVFVTESGAPDLSSAIFLASAGAMLVSRPFIGKIFDKSGPAMLILFGLITFSAGLFLLGKGQVSLFMLSGLLIGLGLSSIYGTTLTIVVSDAPRHRINMANATYFIALDFGTAIGTPIGGRIAEQMGYSVMYFVFAAVILACIPLYFGVLGKRRT